MTDPTIDPKVEIPEDAPLAQGHTTEDAEDARETQRAYKEQVELEAESPEVGPRAPGDHAGEEDESADSGDGVPDGTIDEVKTWVGTDKDRAQQALDAEYAGQNRSTLITHLEGIVNG